MPSSLHFGTRTKLKPEETVILSFVVDLLLSETEPDPGKRRRFKEVKFYQVENIHKKTIPVPLPAQGFYAENMPVNRQFMSVAITMIHFYTKRICFHISIRTPFPAACFLV